MPKSVEFAESESEEEISSEEEPENGAANGKGSPGNQEKLSDYEKLRLNRIEENKRRMEALGLRKIATSFMESVHKTPNKKNEEKGKRKLVDEDEEYNPTQDDEEMSSSAEEDEDDEEFSLSQKKKVMSKTSTPKKRGPVQKPTFDSDFVEDDDALMQAIALSLQDSAGFLDVKSSSPNPVAHLKKTTSSKTPATHTIDTASDKRKESSCIQDDSGTRKRKKPGRQITSRVQMTEDEMLIHFFQFDETGKGGITLRDVERLAIAHDFTWSEKEIAEMIRCFDSDGDGKVSFDDFQNIVGRCKMLKGSDGGGTGMLGAGNCVAFSWLFPSKECRACYHLRMPSLPKTWIYLRHLSLACSDCVASPTTVNKLQSISIFRPLMVSISTGSSTAVKLYHCIKVEKFLFLAKDQEDAMGHQKLERLAHLILFDIIDIRCLE
ncbi:UNVERIFIED_CONTAM: hypothetical protein Sindi_2273300 [Sesamum indicum]